MVYLQRVRVTLPLMTVRSWLKKGTWKKEDSVDKFFVPVYLLLHPKTFSYFCTLCQQVFYQVIKTLQIKH